MDVAVMTFKDAFRAWHQASILNLSWRPVRGAARAPS
ncbi:hypothetical protein PPTG_22216 [Phytophthora nicotianae INRA-310]|uniref:Uncharacterized protein n=1 Tax=Phytophthora nicotianae (strain INRA-310) TaxID=761204 RepID=W2QMW0_PHYN3|nr:hypothetical protein PPTG_22216 [Phytophthora nicotianae INRA-310]ETN14271.1 hypothetical protein PPTG_22216 [Phytophthora nicotianae INRA-310]